MEYVNLGRSGLKVSRACLGAMNFGTSNDAPCGEAESKRIIGMWLAIGTPVERWLETNPSAEWREGL